MMLAVCHDAGGAEIVSSYVRRTGVDCLHTLEGPAVQVFLRKIAPITLQPLDDAIARCDWLLCGTSWQSDLEWRAIDVARKCGKRSIAFLDHWVDYRQRFVRHDEWHLPDEIWVGDALAHARAHELFPAIPIELVPNPYLLDFQDELAAIPERPNPNTASLRVLYVCEPIRLVSLMESGDERHWGYTEEEALRYFLSAVKVLGLDVSRLVVRPHPAEETSKYEWVLSECDLPIVIRNEDRLVAEIADCDMVVGCETMAMVVGLVSGKRVVSSVPPGGRACSLPQPEIEHLRDILSRQST